MTVKSPTTHNPMVGKIIAIDGPAGAGKGTLATSLARVYRMKYLDTGTLYRTVAYNTLKAGGDPSHEADALNGCDLTSFDFKHIGKNQFRVFLNGLDITHEIRSRESGGGASKVAFFPSIRHSLEKFQVDYAKKWASEYGVILDGRDIGTTICPTADFKFFLEAAAEIRADRRCIDLEERGYEANYQEVLSEILERDARDRGRTESPLIQAEDGIFVDTGIMNSTEVLKHITKIIGVDLADGMLIESDAS
jgi:cytidylate kinase